MGLPTPTAVTLSTTGVPKRERLGWLREVIAREYVKVEISPPSEGNLFNEMTIHSLGEPAVARHPIECHRHRTARR